MTIRDIPKTNLDGVLRKHGRQCRQSRPVMTRETDTRVAAPMERLKTILTYESERQAYFWCTDRGRSRLIKH